MTDDGDFLYVAFVATSQISRLVMVCYIGKSAYLLETDQTGLWGVLLWLYSRLVRHWCFVESSTFDAAGSAQALAGFRAAMGKSKISCHID